METAVEPYRNASTPSSQDMDAFRIRLQALEGSYTKALIRIAALEYEVKMLRGFVGGPSPLRSTMAGSPAHRSFGASADNITAGSSSSVSYRKRAHDLLSSEEGADDDEEHEEGEAVQGRYQAHRVQEGSSSSSAAVTAARHHVPFNIGAGESPALLAPVLSSTSTGTSSAASTASTEQCSAYQPQQLLPQDEVEDEDDDIIEVAGSDGNATSTQLGDIHVGAVSPQAAEAALSSCKLKVGDLAWMFTANPPRYWLCKILSSTVLPGAGGTPVIKHRVVFNGGEMIRTYSDFDLITLQWQAEMSASQGHAPIHEEWTLTAKGKRNEEAGWPLGPSGKARKSTKR